LGAASLFLKLSKFGNQILTQHPVFFSPPSPAKHPQTFPLNWRKFAMACCPAFTEFLLKVDAFN
jgi:hypothetical protein